MNSLTEHSNHPVITSFPTEILFLHYLPQALLVSFVALLKIQKVTFNRCSCSVYTEQYFGM